MIKKALYIFEVFIIIAIIYVGGGLFFCSQGSPSSFEISLFKLQNLYAQQVQSKIEDFLQPVVGPGNVKAFVQLKLKNNNQTITQTKYTPFSKVTTTNSDHGIVLEKQNVSIIINATSSVSKNIFQNLISSSLGIDYTKGDTLSVQILPFKEIAPFTFGFSHLTLVRIAGILLTCIFILFLILLALYFKETKTEDDISYQNKKMQQDKMPENWAYILSLSSEKLNTLLSNISKKTLVFALQTAPLQVHQKVAKLLSLSTWNEVLNLYKQTPYSFSESIKAQKEIEDLYNNLIKNKGL